MGRRLAAEVLKGRYLHAEGLGWLRWDGRRWAPATDKELVQVAATWAHKVLVDMVTNHEPDDAIRAVLRYREVAQVRNLVAGALTADGAASLLVKPHQLDANPDLLNVGNGTIDLPTGQLRPADPGDLITKVTPVAYHPGASHGDWNAALTALSAEAADYLQRSFGAAATGHMGSDDRMEVHSGGGSNGKTTIVGATMAALGEYAVLLPDELVSAHSGTQHPTVKMVLRGARLAVLEELPDGHHLNVATVKKVVGTPTITGRLIGRDFVEFTNTVTLVVTTNYLPVVTETDHGTWRRLVRIPYGIEFGKDRPKIPGLRPRCIGGRVQQEAVLAWLVEGARRWYADGRTLGDLPPGMTAAVRDWRANSDLLFSFAEDCLTFSPGREVWERTEDLHAAFNSWLKPPNRHWSVRTFAERITNHPAFAERGALRGLHPQTRQSVVFGVTIKPVQRGTWLS